VFNEIKKGKQNNMKIKRLLLLLALPLLVASCTSYKNVPYLQNPEAVNDFEETLPLYDAKIMPKDLLSITVNTTDPKAATPFNLTVQTPINAALTNISTTTQPTMQQYLVNNKGEIDFPVIGRLEVGGLTKNEAEDLIRERLKPYLKESPIVTVRMSNYKISVLGEVARPGSFTIGNEKVNVLEALAMAGDMTIYGVRDNVKLIREDVNGKREIINLNLNNAEVVTSPYYYLKQNDIIYVTPNKTKAKNSDIGNSTTLWVSSLSILVSIAGLLVNILK
jgi:polysaccharide export outer membrane protein